MSDAKPDLKRDGTMQVGSKETESLTTDAQNKPDEDIETVEDQIDKGGDGDKSEEPSAKKARLSKDITMVDTIKAGKDFLGNEKLGDSRSESAAKKEKPSSKRVSTMAKTALEGEELLKREGHSEPSADSGRRQTRSQTRGGTPSPAKPPVKRSASTPSTPKDGNEVQKRGRKGRPKKTEKKEDDQKESTEETTTEETKDETEDVKEENQDAQEEEEEAPIVEEDEQQQDGNEESAEQTEEKND